LDPNSTPRQCSHKTNSSATPQSNTLTLSTKSTALSGTTASLRTTVARGLNLDSSDEVSVYYKPIEQIPWLDILELRKHAVEVHPDRRTEIMSASPSLVATLVLRDYEPKTLKGLLTFFKAKYVFASLGCIEDHENKTKPQLIKELIRAMGKVNLCRMEQK
jgi:hypothetical protein